MRKWILLLIFSLFSSIAYCAEKAIVLDVNGAIGPASQDYIQQGIEQAEKDKAAFIILQLNTPGGLETSMRSINASIINSTVPVIVYVAPRGARAASAGTFILYASHLAAMAPGTNIGAASPVNISGEESKTLSTAQKKAMNDAAAYIRSLAELRHRNIAWADRAVREGVSISAAEAKNLNVIEIIAENYPDLLAKINDKTVVVNGINQKIQSTNVQIQKVEPEWRYHFLSFITNPNIAYILMLIAFYGLFFELSNPGAVLPGVAGIIALLLVLYAFQLMPINYAGLSLLLVGLGFMIFEVYVSSFGALGIGGVIAFVIGSILLFDTHDENYQLALSLILLMSAVSIAFFFMLITLAIKSQKRAIATGQEGLIGNEGIVLNVMNQQVVVRVRGEIWDARSEIILNPGQKIRVIGIHGLTLLVEPIGPAPTQTGE